MKNISSIPLHIVRFLLYIKNLYKTEIERMFVVIKKVYQASSVCIKNISLYDPLILKTIVFCITQKHKMLYPSCRKDHVWSNAMKYLRIFWCTKRRRIHMTLCSFYTLIPWKMLNLVATVPATTWSFRTLHTCSLPFSHPLFIC